MKLLSIGSNAKTLKSDKSGKGYLTAILYLAPAKTSGRQVCPSASQGCRDSCLFTAGRGAMSNVQKGRLRKTNAFFNDRAGFMKQLDSDIESMVKKCNKESLRPCVRLNGTSDLRWEKLNPELFSKHSEVQFYGYTKIRTRMTQYLNGELPENLHLTFSRSEHNWQYCENVLENGGNVAIVFKNSLPKQYKSYRVYDGDTTDLRFLDPENVIVGLKAKGKAKRDITGFVINN